MPRQLERPRRYQSDVNLHGHLPAVEREVECPQGDHRFEASGVVPNGQEIVHPSRAPQRLAVRPPRPVEQAVDAAFVRNGQRAQQRVIEHVEEDGHRGDAGRERNDERGGKTPIVTERASSGAEVVQQTSHLSGEYEL
jgi:hypothetical protein